MENELYHYGTKRHSGRYPWGSGENPYQHSANWLAEVNRMHKDGMTDVEIAEAFGISTTTLRARRSAIKEEQRAAQQSEALRLKDKGYSNPKIAELMGLSGESQVRSLLKSSLTQRENTNVLTAEVLKDYVEKYGYIDIGKGVEQYLGVSGTRLKTAVQMLQDEGYKVQYLKVEQLGTGYNTSIKVLAGPDAEYVGKHKDEVRLPIGEKYISDDGRTLRNIQDPVSVDPKRVGIKYADDGGAEMDGVILLRRGVEDISLGESRYAQVRIKVGNDMYLKGMAMYSDNLPKGVDLLFNTNKTKADAPTMEKVLKGTKDDPDNPFGATIIRQQGAINIVNEEGRWGEWAKTLSSQMLSKQPVPLAKKQLDLDYSERLKEYEEIMNLTNPVIKKKLLEGYSDNCDSAAVHLKAAALPRQATHVILPFPDIKEDEVYAPNYKQGEKVVLIRFPHAGRFEIPTLTVNNNVKSAKAALGDAPDAIGINKIVADRLSGADFDGDTVLVIPNNNGAIKTAPALKGLEGFDPKEYYKAYEGMPRVGEGDGFSKPIEMGKVSNLITDMTLQGANAAELAAAVRHSMVVIDAQKHNLNWKQSYQDNQIESLQLKYQGKKRGGASTLISRASGDARIPQIKKRMGINKANTDVETGARIDTETGGTYTDPKTGKEKIRLTKTTKMMTVSDARELSMGTPMEEVYADYANKMKALANQARKSYLETPSQEYSPSARKVYEAEVASLTAKLNTALKNSPLERQAQLHANIVVAAKKRANPDMDNDDVKKLKSQALAASRARMGAHKEQVHITDREWEAIQAGAITNNMLKSILDNADLDRVKSLATPRQARGLTDAQLKRAIAMVNRGISQSEVAAQLGVSTSTIYNALHSK